MTSSAAFLLPVRLVKGKLPVGHRSVRGISDQQICVLVYDDKLYFLSFFFKSPEPIRILDLTSCSAVQFDYSQERVNCFW